MSKIIIVGGVAGGATVTARLRRLNEGDEILLFERGEHISFANCGLPYYIGGVISDRQSLLLETPDSFSARYNVDVHINSEVVQIDRKKNLVVVKNTLDGSISTETYDKLILSPGAQPINPAFDGMDCEHVFTLRNVPDADRIKNHITQNHAKEIAIIGAGFIGLEMAEALHGLGIKITIIEKLKQILPNVDPEIVAPVADHLKEKGVELLLGAGIIGFKNDGRSFFVKLEGGREIKCDAAILSIGVRPDTKIAVDAGLDVEPNGAICVDASMRTNDKNIYAIGDAVVVKNPVIDAKWGVALAGPANKQARIVAGVINGTKEKYDGAIGTSIVKCFEMIVAQVGCSEGLLQKHGIQYEKSYTHSMSHAGYYPGASLLSIKLIFDKSSGKIFGATVTGINGVDKRIDVLAQLIQRGATVHELANAEFSYAPQFGSAKDPANVAGCVADNIVRDICEVCHWHDVENFISAPDKYVLLDVRTKGEFQAGTINGAVNIPIDVLRERINEIPRDKTIIAFCHVGMRGYLAHRILKQHSYNVMNLSGGILTYSRSSDIKK